MRINSHVGSANIKIDTKRIDRNLRNAQAALNTAIRDDCEQLVPHLNGGLRGSFRFGNGDVHSGFVEWTAPYSHFQYIGLVRTDENGRVWVRKHEEKPVLTDRVMKHHESGTTDHWFEKSKEKNLDKWVKIVKDEMGKG